MPQKHIESLEQRPPLANRKANSGIKALITCGDLGSLLAAARKWYAHQSEQGIDATKLLHHIANAEAIYLKCNRRNKAAYERREERRLKDAADALVEATVTAAQSLPDGSGFDTANKSVWDKLGDALRPTKW